jgi:hypothetical protein
MYGRDLARPFILMGEHMGSPLQSSKNKSLYSITLKLHSDLRTPILFIRVICEICGYILACSNDSY